LSPLSEVFGSKKRMAFFAIIVALVGGVTIWHSLGSTTMKNVAERPVADLEAVYVTKGPNVFPLEREKWNGLLSELAAARGTRNTGGKGAGWGALVCFELDWGESGRYWVRLQTREGLGDRVIANMEEPMGGGSFHHQGRYEGGALFRWIMADPPRLKGFAHKVGGPGCPPRRGVAPSPLLKTAR